jgi:hypothetical protein
MMFSHHPFFDRFFIDSFKLRGIEEVGMEVISNESVNMNQNTIKTFDHPYTKSSPEHGVNV